MITELTGLPAGQRLRGHRDVRAEDYRDVLLPAIERAAVASEVRVVIVISSFGGMTGSVLWEDLKMGARHLHAWKRTALVTDIGWMTHLTARFGWMSPGQTKHFPLVDRDAAIAWTAG
jgi:hypothetical protein